MGIDMPVFGPVPSRRLGRSLGINNIPPKSCSYSCIYCQVGPTRATEIMPRAFYTPQRIQREVEAHLAQAGEQGEAVDYLTFVPDGEPTLDAQLGESMKGLRPLGIPIAVISDASLIWRREVRETLARVDWVSLKLDAVEEAVREFLANVGADWSLVERLIGQRELMQTEYEGRRFYVRRIRQGSGSK